METCRRLLDQAMDDVLLEAQGDRDEALRSLVLENVLLRLSLARLKGKDANTGDGSEIGSLM